MKSGKNEESENKALLRLFQFEASRANPEEAHLEIPECVEIKQKKN